MPAPATVAPATLRALFVVPLLLAPCGGSAPSQSDPAPLTGAAQAEVADLERVAAPLPAVRARLELPVTGKPEGVLLRDLDADGRAELIAVSREPGRLTVWAEPPSGWKLLPPREELAIGDYALGPLAFEREQRDAVLIASRSQPSLALIDALADGGPVQLAGVDLPAAPRAIATGKLANTDGTSALCVDRAGTLHVWNGAGDVRSQPGFTTQASALCLARDGRRLAIADRTSHEVVFYQWDGERFERERTVPLTGIPRDIAEADENGDGSTEFLVAGGDHHLWTIPADPEAPISVRDTGDIPLRLEVIDSDETGTAPGFLLLPFYRLQVMQYELGGDEQRTTYSGQTPWDLSSGDWNGDGAREVVIANRDAHRISVIFEDPNGAWRVDRRIPTGRGPDVVIGGDLRPGEGPQLAAFCALDGTLRLHTASDDWAPLPALEVGAGAAHPRLLPAGRRGRPGGLIWTVAHAVAEDRSRRWLSQLERGDDGLRASLICELTPSAADLCVAETQLGAELWVADDESANLRRFSADGQLRGEIIPGIPALQPVALATWQGPGGANVVAACRTQAGGTRLFLYRETTTIWSDDPPLDCDLIPIDVEAADVDGDGDVDLCLLGKPREGDGPGAVTVFLRDGDSWRATRQLETGLRPYALASGDLNGDGRADLVVSAQNSHQLNLYLGRAGDAVLARSADLGAGTGSLGLWIGDLDGDGRPELVAANAFSNDLSLIRFDR